jgi:hypothetical protein
VEGQPIFDTYTDGGYKRLEIPDSYFNFDDCWLDADDESLEKLQQAGGAMRV